jgi:hypothetical protein
MSLKGTMRSLSAAQRRMAREAARRDRERARLLAQEEKERAYEEAVDEASEYEAYIDFLVSFHKECRESMDWERISSGPEPIEPVKEDYTENETNARTALESYEPGRMDKLLRRDTKIREELEEKVVTARQLDREELDVAIERYRADVEAYELSEGIVNGDPNTYLETLEIASNGIVGLDAHFEVSDDLGVKVIVDIDDDSVIPNETKSVLKTGKLSVKKMPVTKYWQLYQDYASSLALRFACEILALLPIDLILVDIRAPLLNTKTGHKELSNIISVAVSRSTLNKLNMETLDPSDAMENFVHRMKFSGRTGFKSIEPLMLTEFDQG